MAAIGDFLAIDAAQHIAGADAGSGTRTAGDDRGDEQAAGPIQTRKPGAVRRQGFTFDADPAADQLAGLRRGKEHLHHFRRDGKADAVGAARLREDRGVDAHQPTLAIEQRTARIAGIDCGIGLDEELPIRNADASAGDGGNDAGRHCLADAERVADGDGDVADFGTITVAHADHRQPGAAGIDLEQRQIETGIGKYHLGRKLAAIRQRDKNLIGTADNMIVGDDQAIGADDDT